MQTKNSTKLIAMYFTQLHAIAENDLWWGKGFTDWVNVKAAKPQFQGHLQPRIPLNENYYDQSVLGTLYGQVDLAKKHGIYGFCHYHYWFDGKQLLETPTNLMLQNKDLDMPFCLSWANETWSKRWDGQNHHILIKQTHPPEKARWKLHFDYLLKAWSDERSIKIDGKPVFAIYRPQNIPLLDQMLDYWRELAHTAGLNGLYFMHQKQYELSDRSCLKGFDAMFQFQPFEAIYSPGFKQSLNSKTKFLKFIQTLPPGVQDTVRSVYLRFFKDLTYYDYDEVWKIISQVQKDPELTSFPGAFVDWDNTARYKNRATIFKNANPERFRFWLNKLVESMPSRNLPENFIFINAWNEWAESAYLEPDAHNDHEYLKAVSDVLHVN